MNDHTALIDECCRILHHAGPLPVKELLRRIDEQHAGLPEKPSFREDLLNNLPLRLQAFNQLLIGRTLGKFPVLKRTAPGTYGITRRNALPLKPRRSGPRPRPSLPGEGDMDSEQTAKEEPKHWAKKPPNIDAGHLITVINGVPVIERLYDTQHIIIDNITYILARVTPK